MNMAAHIVDDQGEIELADFLPRRRLVTVPVFRSDAEKAGGEEIVRRTIEAVASPDDPALRAKAADAVAALKSIAPRTPVEAGNAGLLVAMQAAAFDCLAIARVAGFDTQMGVVMIGRAEKLTCRANELSEALARRGSRGRQVIRVEHITIESGASAVIGNVAQEDRNGDAL
jgi:hypothetical protein